MPKPPARRRSSVAPIDPPAYAPSAQRPVRFKVRRLAADTRVDPKSAAEAGIRLDGFVGSDNYEGGKVAGETNLFLADWVE